MSTFMDKIWGIIVNKGHVLLAALCQGTILVYHFKTGHDVGPNVMNTVYAFYGFLAGHFGVSQKWPDKDNDGVPDNLESHGPLPDPTPTAPAPATLPAVPPVTGAGSDGAKG